MPASHCFYAILYAESRLPHHPAYRLARTISFFCAHFWLFWQHTYKNWRPRQNCQGPQLSQANQATDRDTTCVFGPNRNNGLETRPGHTCDDLTNEIPGATAIATGAKDVVESVCIEVEITTLYPILQRHWGALV